MTGSLTVKNGKYYAVLNVYEDGKRKKKWICSNLAEKGNKRKAEQFLREKIAEYERMEGIVHSDVLFADYVTIWLEHIARTVDDITMQGYRTTAKCHVLPYFTDKKIKLCDVDCKVLQQYINHVGKEVEVLARDGKKYRGVLARAEAEEFALTVQVKERPEGAKRPVLVDKEYTWKYDEVKYTKYIINF